MATDPFGLLPASIRARYEARDFVDKVRSSAPAARALREELRSAFGPEMDVVFVRPDIAASELPDGAVRGRWHVRRDNPVPESPTYMAILGENGAFREPDALVIAELAKRDLRRSGVLQGFLDRSRTDRPDLQRERDLRREQRRDVMAADYKAARRVRGEGGLKKSFQRKREAA